MTGHEIVESFGLVKESTIRAKHVGRDILSVFRQIVGGELKEYSEMIQESRQISTTKMVEEAEKLRADATLTTQCGNYKSGF